MKKKKFPASVTLCGRKYKIKQGKNLVYNGQPCLGLCDNQNRIIYLEADQEETSKRETLLHELAHAFMNLVGIDQKLTEAEAEIYCQVWTMFFHDVEAALK